MYQNFKMHLLLCKIYIKKLKLIILVKYYKNIYIIFRYIITNII